MEGTRFDFECISSFWVFLGEKIILAVSDNLQCILGDARFDLQIVQFNLKGVKLVREESILLWKISSLAWKWYILLILFIFNSDWCSMWLVHLAVLPYPKHHITTKCSLRLMLSCTAIGADFHLTLPRGSDFKVSLRSKNGEKGGLFTRRPAILYSGLYVCFWTILNSWMSLLEFHKTYSSS